MIILYVCASILLFYHSRMYEEEMRVEIETLIWLMFVAQFKNNSF